MSIRICSQHLAWLWTIPQGNVPFSSSLCSALFWQSPFIGGLRKNNTLAASQEEEIVQRHVLAPANSHCWDSSDNKPPNHRGTEQ